MTARAARFGREDAWGYLPYPEAPPLTGVPLTHEVSVPRAAFVTPQQPRPTGTGIPATYSKPFAFRTLWAGGE